jgi:hypothetical protein
VRGSGDICRVDALTDPDGDPDGDRAEPIAARHDFGRRLSLRADHR